MDSQEAIEVIESLWCWDRCTKKEHEALNKAIEALRFQRLIDVNVASQKKGEER